MSKSSSSSESERAEAPPLTGSRRLLVAAWIAWAVWLALLMALAAHVLGWW